MNKIGVSLFCIFLVLSGVTFVLAAGTSTGSGNTPNQNTIVAQGSTNRTNVATPAAVRPCEDREGVRDRILCRIQTHAESENAVEESCRRLSTREDCVSFQHRASPCYEKSAREKALCLRETAGLGAGQLNRFAAEDRRKYAALLLYELQERIEEKQEEGKITDEEAADLITQIVDLKESLLNNTPISEVKTKMTSFKQAYLEAMQ